MGDTHAESDSVEELSTVDSEDLFCFLDIILRDVLCYKCSKDTKLLYGREAVVHIVEMGERYSFRALGRWGEYMERYRKESCIMCRVPCS